MPRSQFSWKMILTTKVYVDGAAVGSMKTNMSGKLSVSVELEEGTSVKVKADKERHRKYGKAKTTAFLLQRMRI